MNNLGNIYTYIISEFKKFARTTNSVEAEKKVKELLSSGRMTKQQYEDFKRQANSIMKFLK